jgi:hypothetical protein
MRGPTSRRAVELEQEALRHENEEMRRQCMTAAKALCTMEHTLQGAWMVVTLSAARLVPRVD